jgi:hypothetical protein
MHDHHLAGSEKPNARNSMNYRTKEDLLMYGTVLEAPIPVQLSTDGLKMRILEQVNEESVIGLDSLVQMLPEYSWNQIFSAVDQLARAGRIVLRRHRYDYTLFSTAYPT